MLRACVVCGIPSDESRCPTHRYTRRRGARQRRQRQQIIERDQYRCQRCGVYLTGQRDTHVDHIIPLSKGGSENPANLRTLCARCNQQKGAT